MKKILIALAVIVSVGAVIAGATGAFYNDTETSTGNIFVAGSVDLKVDHTRQTYNGVDCQTCRVEVVSDTTNTVVEKNGAPFGPQAAVLVSNPHPAWTANVPGASWIWATDPVTQEDVVNDVTYTFRKEFTWFGPLLGATIDFSLGSDNSYEVWLNGVKIDEDPAENNFTTADSISISGADIVQGTNVLEFVVKNWAQPNGSPASNPAGLLYKLTINGDCEDSYFLQHCSLFAAKDLDGSEQFFNFDDIKPGDFGTNVISLHVDDNDSWACLIVHDDDDQENTLLETEEDAGDAPNQGNPLGFGELSNYLEIFVWEDDNDGVYEPSDGETALYGPDSIQTEIIQMSLVGATTQYAGLAWCAGTLQVAGDGTMTCDGSTMLDDAQSDSYTASLTAYAEQQRNNPDFQCSEVDLDNN